MNANAPIVLAGDDPDRPAFQQPDWPPEFRCPFVPWRPEGTNLMFQERFARPGHAPRRVWISGFQLSRGLIGDLEISPAYLAEHFPPVPIEVEAGAACVQTDGPYAWSIRLVADWLRHHIAEVTEQREKRYSNRQRRGPPPQPPAPADVFHLVRPSSPSTAQIITTLTAQRHDDGRRRINVTCVAKGAAGGEAERAFSGILTQAEAHAIAEVLVGRRIAP